MKALILAAGRGSRLASLTKAQPKCLTWLAGRSLLEWQLTALKSAGIKDITLIKGYRGDCLENQGCHTLENPRWAITNMVATLGVAGKLLEQDPFLVLYSDIVYHPEHLLKLSAADGDIVITYDQEWLELWQQRSGDPLSDAETFRQSEGRLLEIGRKPESLEEIQGQYMGMLKITPTGWQWIRDFLTQGDANIGIRLDMTSLLRGLVDSGHQIRCVPVTGRWCEVDTETDLQCYEQKIREVDETGVQWRHDWRWEVRQNSLV
jgi:L-glutamine-phosphate cytidylyltransferase